jgi:uncharacterized protein (UPF0147 family)
MAAVVSPIKDNALCTNVRRVAKTIDRKTADSNKKVEGSIIGSSKELHCLDGPSNRPLNDTALFLHVLMPWISAHARL